MLRQSFLNEVQFAPRKSIVFAQPDPARRTTQNEHSFTVGPNHMDTRWPMVIGIDDDPEAANSEDCGHNGKYNKQSKRLGYLS